MIVKKQALLQRANQVFGNTEIKIGVDGERLGCSNWQLRSQGRICKEFNENLVKCTGKIVAFLPWTQNKFCKDSYSQKI